MWYPPFISFQICSIMSMKTWKQKREIKKKSPLVKKIQKQKTTFIIITSSLLFSPPSKPIPYGRLIIQLRIGNPTPSANFPPAWRLNHPSSAFRFGDIYRHCNPRAPWRKVGVVSVQVRSVCSERKESSAARRSTWLAWSGGGHVG